jgi:DUF4097 and DUF4098 domain-containing protein YvlB
MKPSLKLIGAALLAAAITPAAQAASRPVDQKVAAGATGTVEIINVAGNVDLQGWDRPEVAVTGTVGDDVDRIELTASGTHVTMRVVEKKLSMGWGKDAGARLVVHVPAKSMLDVSLVSADLQLSGLQGDGHIQSVSGDIRGEAGGNSLELTTVSGDVQLTARNAHELRMKTVSGDLMLTGPGGEVAFTTVSGDGHLELGAVSRLRLESVSGDMLIKGALAANGQVEASSVSGDVQLEFAGVPDADFELTAFSGDLRSCLANAQPVKEKYGPESKLNFRSGKGGGRVRVDTKSGDVSVCTAH